MSAAPMTVERLVALVAAHRTSRIGALSYLTRHGLTSNAHALEAAVELLRTVDDLRSGVLCPFTYMDCEPRAGVDVLGAALRRAEEELSWMVAVLAKPAAVAS